MEHFGEHRLYLRVLGGIVRYARHIVIFYVLACLASLSVLVDIQSGKPRLELDPSVDSMLPRHDEDRNYFEKIRAVFPGGDAVLVALEDDDIFTTDNLARIQAISDEIESLEQVQRVSSLSRALNIRSSEGNLLIQPFYEAVPETQEALDDLRQRALSDPIYAGNLVTTDARLTVIAVYLLDIPEKELLASRVDEHIAEIARKHWTHSEVHVTGSPHIKAEMSRAMLHDLAVIVPLALIVMAIMAGVSFRTPRGVIIPILTLAVSVILTLVFVALYYGTLNQVTVAVPSLLVVVGFSYGVHVLAGYYDVLRAQSDGVEKQQDSAVLLALRSVAVPVIYTAITTAVGFYSLATSPLTAIQEFGVAAGTGVMITLLVSLSFTPALLQLMPVPRQLPALSMDHWIDRALARIALFSIRRAKVIFMIASLIGVAALLALPFIKVGTDMVNSFRESNEVRQDFYAVNNKLNGANAFSIIMETSVEEGFQDPRNLRVIENLQQWLAQQPEVGASTSLVDYIKVIHQGMYDDNAHFVIPATQSEVAELLFLGSNEELKETVDFAYQKTRITVRIKVVDSADVMQLVRRLEQYVADQVPSHLHTRVTGNSYLVSKTMDDIAWGQAISFASAFILIYLIMVVVFMSFKSAFIAMIPNVLPVLLYFGILGWFGIPLNVTSGLIACIVLGIAVDDTIHLMSHFNTGAKKAADESQGVMHALQSVGRPVAFTTIALCMGFMCMIFSDMRSQVEFGILAAITLLGAWVVDMTLTPAIASRMKIVSLWDVLSLDLGDSPHKTIPLFRGLTATQARIAALLAEIKEYKAGDKIFRIGERGNHMYVVIDGAIAVSLSNQDGTQFFQNLGRGDIIGEVALYHGERTADVYASSKVRLLQITKADLENIQRRHPKIAAQLYANLNEVFAGRVASLTTHIRA